MMMVSNMTFKDFLQQDLNTFINPDEFGNLHKLDSKEIMMIIEEDEFGLKKGLTSDYEDSTQGVFESAIIIYLRSTDFKKPSVGKRIKLDGDNYYVVEASNSDGVLKIKLAANES